MHFILDHQTRLYVSRSCLTDAAKVLTLFSANRTSLLRGADPSHLNFSQMEFVLRCNDLKCRAQLHERAIVTTCRHVPRLHN
jgi:hypothetical protein